MPGEKLAFVVVLHCLLHHSIDDLSGHHKFVNIPAASLSSSWQLA